MATVRAFIHHYDDRGRRTRPAERVFAILATNATPQVLDIRIPDKRTTRFRSIQISRAELERALATPARKARP